MTSFAVVASIFASCGVNNWALEMIVRYVLVVPTQCRAPWRGSRPRIARGHVAGVHAPIPVPCSKKQNPDGDPGAGPLLTLFQFVFIALATLPDVISTSVRAAIPPPATLAAVSALVSSSSRSRDHFS